jgi:hypothetical protein
MDAITQYRKMVLQLKQEGHNEKNAKERLQNAMDIGDSEKVKLTERITQYGKDIDQLKNLYMQIVSEKNALHREKETLK